MPLFFKPVKRIRTGPPPPTNADDGEPLCPLDQKLIAILGKKGFPKEVPVDATYGQLLAGVNWEIPGVTALTKPQIDAIAKVMETRSGRKYKWGAGACCTCTW